MLHTINSLFRTFSKPYTTIHLILKTVICLCDTIQQDPDYDPDCECDSCLAIAQRYVQAARMVYALDGFGDDSSDEQ